MPPSTPHFMSPTAAASAKAGQTATTPAKAKKTKNTTTTKTTSKTSSGGSVPHFMSPTAAGSGTKTKTKTRSGARPVTSRAPSAAAGKVSTPKKPAAKAKTKARAPPTTTATATGGLAATIVPSRRKPTVADPAAPRFRRPGPSADLALFRSTFAPLVDLGDPAARRGRAAAWRVADPGGGGVLGLAEAEAWILTALVAEHRPFKGQKLHRLYRPAYRPAFDAARSLGDGGGGDGGDGDVPTTLPAWPRPMGYHAQGSNIPFGESLTLIICNIQYISSE